MRSSPEQYGRVRYLSAVIFGHVECVLQLLSLIPAIILSTPPDSASLLTLFHKTTSSDSQGTDCSTFSLAAYGSGRTQLAMCV